MNLISKNLFKLNILPKNRVREVLLNLHFLYFCFEKFFAVVNTFIYIYIYTYIYTIQGCYFQFLPNHSLKSNKLSLKMCIFSDLIRIIICTVRQIIIYNWTMKPGKIHTQTILMCQNILKQNRNLNCIHKLIINS